MKILIQSTSRSQWFDGLSDIAKKVYLNLHPKSKFGPEDHVSIRGQSGADGALTWMEHDPDGKTVSQHVQDATDSGDHKVARHIEKLAHLGVLDQYA